MFWEINATRHWQATKKNTKKTTTRCTKPSQAPKKTKNTKKHNPSIYSGFWTPHACQCFVRLCFVVFCFFVPANVFRASLQNKMQKNAPRFQSHQMQKTSVFTMFCVHFHSNITSMVPRSPKKWVTTFVVLGGGVVQIYTQHVSVYIPRFHLKEPTFFQDKLVSHHDVMAWHRDWSFGIDELGELLETSWDSYQQVVFFNIEKTSGHTLWLFNIAMEHHHFIAR